MKMILTIGLFGQLVVPVIAQNVIQNTYTFEPINSWMWYRGATNDVNGFTMLSRPLDMDTDTMLRIGLLRTDAVGALLETRLLRTDGSDAPVHILRSPDGTGWIAGMHSMPPVEDHSARNAAMLMRIDEQDNVEWAEVYPLTTGHSTTVFDIVELSDGGVALLCSKAPWPGEEEVPLVIRCDVNGVVLWCKRLNMERAQLWYMDVLPGDRLILSGGIIDSTGNRDVLLAALEADGAGAWARAFGNGFDDMAKRVVHDPWHGLVVAGYSHVGEAESRGFVLRTDIYGEGQQTFFYGSSAYDAHAFPDGSVMLFARVPESTQMVRLDAEGSPLWATALDVLIGEGRLLPYAEGSHFAYFSGDMMETIALNTFTAQCVSCGQTGDLTEAGEPAVLPEHPVAISTVDIAVINEPVEVSVMPFMVTRSLECSITAVDEHADAAPERSCNRASGGSVTCSGFEAETTVLLDAVGRVAHLPSTVLRSGDPTRFSFQLPDLAPGVYVLTDGRGGCTLPADPFGTER